MTTTVAAVTDVGRLLAAYEPGTSAYLGSPRGAILARGVRAHVPSVTPDELATRADSVLRDVDGQIVVGAIGFDPSSVAHLLVPDRVERANPDGRSAIRALGGGLPAGWAVRGRPDREAYRRAVVAALDAIERGDLTKVVLARSLELTAASPVDVRAILATLVRRDPRAYPFAVPLPGRTPDEVRTLVGASPELLVSRYGDTVAAEPMAGSMPRSIDPADDERAAKELLASDKDRAEHAYVVDSVMATLAPVCTRIEASAEPILTSTATMWHLATHIEGTLRPTSDGIASSLALALALHPTPAVCGTPTAAARSLITELEGFDRSYYSGAVGWCDRDGNGEWVIALRCAEVAGAEMRLFAGAGIVAGSEPDAELAETSAKLRTLLQAMDVEGDL